MRYEITSLGADGVHGVVARAPLVPAPNLRTQDARDDALVQGPRPVVQVEAQHAAFAALALRKDEASQVAQAAREAHRALEIAQTTLEAMQQAVDAVLKQYPPFPPGSEERLSYLNSIAALRQQLDAVTVPPPTDRLGPIFYPRADALPALDYSRASDEDVAAFGRALDALRQGLAASRSALREQVDALPHRVHATLPPPRAESEVLAGSWAMAAGLSAHGTSILRNAATLAQVSG